MRAARPRGAGPQPARGRLPHPQGLAAWRGQDQLGSLGGGSHLIELPHDGERLWVMYHTGSRGFGHGLATHSFVKAATGTD
jgi:RNA-splicing ligase RtcB